MHILKLSCFYLAGGSLLVMLRIRFKMGPSTNRNKEWSCCFGLHVRTVTVMIGCWHLVTI